MPAPTLSRETLSLLHRVLLAQQLSVGDENFRGTAKAVLTALDELEQALADAPADV